MAVLERDEMMGGMGAWEGGGGLIRVRGIELFGLRERQARLGWGWASQEWKRRVEV